MVHLWLLLISNIIFTHSKIKQNYANGGFWRTFFLSNFLTTPLYLKKK